MNSHNINRIEKNAWLVSQAAADPKKGIKLWADKEGNIHKMKWFSPLTIALWSKLKWADKNNATSADLEKALSETASGIKEIFEKKHQHYSEVICYAGVGKKPLLDNLSKDTSKGGIFVRDNKPRTIAELIGLSPRKRIDLRNFADNAEKLDLKQPDLAPENLPVDGTGDGLNMPNLKTSLSQLKEQTVKLNSLADITNKIFNDKAKEWMGQ